MDAHHFNSSPRTVLDKLACRMLSSLLAHARYLPFSLLLNNTSKIQLTQFSKLTWHLLAVKQDGNQVVSGNLQYQGHQGPAVADEKSRCSVAQVAQSIYPKPPKTISTIKLHGFVHTYTLFISIDHHCLVIENKTWTATQKSWGWSELHTL